MVFRGCCIHMGPFRTSPLCLATCSTSTMTGARGYGLCTAGHRASAPTRRNMSTVCSSDCATRNPEDSSHDLRCLFQAAVQPGTAARVWSLLCSCIDTIIVMIMIANAGNTGHQPAMRQHHGRSDIASYFMCSSSLPSSHVCVNHVCINKVLQLSRALEMSAACRSSRQPNRNIHPMPTR
jgi:hypothetical protein